MQTTVNVAQAFGLVGEMYDLTPRRVDAYEVATQVTMGAVAGFSTDGKVGAMGTGYPKFAGVVVRPHEAINYGGAAGALAASITQPAGATVQVCSMGRVVVAIPTGATWVDGDTLFVTTAGAFANATATGSVEVGKIIKGGAAGEVAVIELGC